jgi:hypothetical protein
MAAEVPETKAAEAVPSLPEKIERANLEALNKALAALFDGLRFASNLAPGEARGRQGAVVALRAAWKFLMQFESVRAETLHVPLLTLSSALLALNENNIEPILMPRKRSGRAASSPRRYALIGIAVGAAQRLEWVGLSPADANKAVTTKLNNLGIKPTRGKNGVTADTLRRWREQISVVRPLLPPQSQLEPRNIGAEDIGWINAATNADNMLTEEWRGKIAALPPTDARRFILSALKESIQQMGLSG